MWHFTDAYYHTNLDRLEMVSPDEMKNVGVSTLAAGFTLVNASEKTTLQLIKETRASASERISKEFALSKDLVSQKGNIKDQQHIIDVWGKYYSKAFETMNTICTCGTSKKINKAIAKAKKSTEGQAAKLMKELE
jgi:hypothetical protein